MELIIKNNDELESTNNDLVKKLTQNGWAGVNSSDDDVIELLENIDAISASLEEQADKMKD